MTNRFKSARATTAVFAMVGTAALLAACSSSSKPSASSSSTTAVAAASPGSAGSGSGTDSQVATAAAYAHQAEQVPTVIPITTPLNSKPPTGKTFVFMQCDIDQCTTEAQALKTVTAAIGWNLKTIPYQSANPATLISAMQQALQYNPVAVGLSGIPEAAWASVLPAYKKAGVPIVVAYVGPQPLDNTVIANIGDATSVTLDAKALASYFIANSNGKGHILQFQVPDFPILNTFDQAFRSAVQAGCSGCSVTPLNGTIAQVTSGGAPAAIVSALQRDPSIGWVVTDDGPWVAGLPAAAAAAGVHVKIIGEGADTLNETDIKAGKQTAFTGLALNYGQWAMIDAVLRHLEGMPIPANEGTLPIQLLTQNDNFTVSNSYDQPADYATQMKKLWHLS